MRSVAPNGHDRLCSPWHCVRCKRRPSAACHKASLEDAAAKLFREDPKARERLSRVGEAAARVAALQEAQREIHQLSAESAAPPSEQEQAQLASERGANADVLTAAEELQDAIRDVQDAQASQQKWSTAVNEEAERVESGKAAAIAGAAGVAADLPYLLFHPQQQPLLSGSLSVLGAAGTCALFGLCYRYAIRQDLNNAQLKAGVVAAFGLARGIAQADALQSQAASSGGSPFAAEVLGPAALLVGQSLLVTLVASIALEAAFRRRWLKPFGGLE